MSIKLHPPLKPGEKFLGNQQGSTPKPHLKDIKGIRYSQPAYDLYGKTIPGYFALIATPEAADQYNAIMERRLSDIRRGATTKP